MISPDQTDLQGAALAAGSPREVKDPDAEAPLAVVPAGIELSPAEAAALGRMMEYTRKGSMKKRMVSRQQWIEDMLTRGFTEVQTLKHGRAPERLRISAPERLDRRGKAQFYEVQSAIEIAYVRRRHADLFKKGSRTEAQAEGVAIKDVTPPRRPKPATEAVQSAPVTGAEKNTRVRPETVKPAETAPRATAAPGESASSAVFAADWADTAAEYSGPNAPEWAGGALNDDLEDLAAAIVVHQKPSNPEAAEKALRQARYFAAGFGQATERGRVGEVLAVLERQPRPDAWAEEAWVYLQIHGLGRTLKTQQSLPEGRPLRDSVREWAGEERWVNFLRERSDRQKAEQAEAVERDTQPLEPSELDFSYPEGAIVAPVGKKTRIRANMEAIRLLKKLEAEDRLATPEEKTILSKFNGWGEHKSIFENNDQLEAMFQRYYGADYMVHVREKAANDKTRYGSAARDFSNEVRYLSWFEDNGELHKELKGLLTAQEWDAASRSILNAHYTEESVCHFLWKMVRRAGFKGGRVIEPAVGASGRILGAMPPDLRALSKVEAVELDSISARMATKLYPQTKVHECGFEEALIAPGSADLVITNVPFSENGPGVQEGLGPVSFNLHNYFIAESMRKLKPGGLGVIITSASTMQNNDDQRAELAKQAELWGAVRLPSDAFAGSAGTDVVTDVLLLRKPDMTYQDRSEEWSRLMPVHLTEAGRFKLANQSKKKGQDEDEEPKEQYLETALVNEYYASHPDMVLGYNSLLGKMYGRDNDRGQYTVTSPKDAPAIGERLEKILPLMPEAVPNSSDKRGGRAYVGSDAEKLMANLEEVPGSLVMRDNGKRLYIVRPSRELISPEWELSGDLPPGFRKLEDAMSMARDFCALREILNEQISIDLNKNSTDDASEEHRKALHAAYKKFEATHGTLNDATKKLRGLAPQDTTLSSVLALEQVREVAGENGGRRRKVVIPAQILTKRTLFPPERSGPQRADTLEHAILASLNQVGGVDLPYIADMLGRQDLEELANEIAKEGHAFRSVDDPTVLEHRSIYLTGDVLTKLEGAKKAAEVDPRFGSNVAALEAVAPQAVPFDRVRAPFGATWVPGHVYSDFIREVAGANLREGDSPVYDQRSQTWIWMALDTVHSAAAASRFGTDRRAWHQVVREALAQNPTKVMDIHYTEGGGSYQVFNPAATAAVRARIDALGAAWTSWIGQREDTKKLLTDEFNRRFNRVVVPQVDGAHLTFPGMATGPGALVPRFYQRDSVARFLAKPAGVVAHGTGYGKTLTGILIAHESRRLGLARKPLIVCDSANYAQFVDAHRRVYPQDRILVADDSNFSPGERENFKAMVAYGDWDCVLMSRTQFERIPLSQRTLAQWLSEEIGDLRYSLELAKTGGDKRSQRAIEKRLEKKQESLKAYVNDKAGKADAGLTWEQLGVDLLEVDECHRHKKAGFATAFGHIKGIDPNESNRGRDLLMKARIIQNRRKGMGCIGLSGTPATNTMAEFWNMNRIFAPNTLEEFGVNYFDEFKTTFCVTETRLEMNEANGKFRYVERMSKFVNGHALAGFVRSGCDLQLDPTKLNLKLPAHKTGSVEQVVVPITDAVLDEMDNLAALYKKYEDSSDKKELSWVPLTLMSMGMGASIDPRMINPSAPDEADSLLNTLIRNVTEIYEETAAERKTQVIFLDRYRTMNTSILSKLTGSADLKNVRIELDETEEEASAEDPDDLDSVNPDKKEKAEDAVVINRGVNLYEEIKAKLIANGVKPEEISLISDAKNAKERGAIFERVNRGEVRVVVGSSDKLGIGANFQSLLYAAHNFDPPRNMTPDQQEQRDGRIIRSGNTNETIRNFLYGMQDTCTVAIWNRIQTKRRFIRQGLSATGGEDEIEDVGEIRLDEFKAALVADKRLLRVAELNGSIKDERMAIEVGMQRKSTLESRMRGLERSIRAVETRDLPAAVKEAEWLAKAIKPFDQVIEVDVSDLRKLVGNDALKGWFDKRQEAGKPDILTGAPELVEKELSGFVDALKETKLDKSATEKPLGLINVNGLPVRLTYAQVTFKSSGREADALLMRIPNPLVSDRPFCEHTQFGSASMLLRTAGNVVRRGKEAQASAEMMLIQYKEDLATIQREAATVEEPTTERLYVLEADLKALEQDMIEKPYVRGSKREAKAVIAVADEVLAAGAEKGTSR